MTLVLDTHAWLWFLQAEPRLGRKAKAAIDRAAARGGAVISAITPWEVSLLAAKGRLVFKRDVRDWLHDRVSLPGFVLHPLSLDVAVESTRLPGALHADPADHIIVATARGLGAPLVTADERLLAYGRSGHVSVLDADV